MNQEEQLGANCIGTLFMYSTDSSGQWAANSYSLDGYYDATNQCSIYLGGIVDVHPYTTAGHGQTLLNYTVSMNGTFRSSGNPLVINNNQPWPTSYQWGEGTHNLFTGMQNNLIYISGQGGAGQLDKIADLYVTITCQSGCSKTFSFILGFYVNGQRTIQFSVNPNLLIYDHNDVSNNVISTSLSYNINQWINPTHEFEDGGLTGGFDCGGGVEQQLLPGSFSRTYRRISYKPDTTLPVNYIAYQKVGDINGHCTANAPYTIQ